MSIEASPLPLSAPMPHATERAPSLWAALGLIVLYFVLQSVVSTLLAMGVGTAADALHIQHTDNGIQTLLVMLSLGIVAPLVLWLARRKWPQLWSLARPPGFGFTLPRRLLFFALAVVAGLAVPLLGGLLTQVLAHDHAVTQDIQQFGGSTPLGLRIPLVLVVVSLGPLVEELLFRSVLLSALLQRWHVGWAVTISSLAFALVHLPGLQLQWYALPNLALLALTLAWLRLHSGSIWPAVLAHGINNLLAVVAWFVTINPAG